MFRSSVAENSGILYFILVFFTVNNVNSSFLNIILMLI